MAWRGVSGLAWVSRVPPIVTRTGADPKRNSLGNNPAARTTVTVSLAHATWHSNCAQFKFMPENHIGLAFILAALVLVIQAVARNRDDDLNTRRSNRWSQLPHWAEDQRPESKEHNQTKATRAPSESRALLFCLQEECRRTIRCENWAFVMLFISGLFGLGTALLNLR